MPILSIGESKPKKWMPLAWLIQLAESSDHSHSYVSYKDSRIPEIRYVSEARGSGCRLLSNAEFKIHNEVVRVFEYEVPQDVLDDIHKEIYFLLARPYSKKQLVGLGLIRLCKLLGFKISNPFKDGDFSQICVEASARALYKALQLPIPFNVEDYGLKEMHALNLKHGKLVPQDKIDRINKKS